MCVCIVVVADDDGTCFYWTFWSLTAPCLMYTGGAASMVGAWFIHWPVRPMRGLYGPSFILGIVFPRNYYNVEQWIF